MRVLYGVAYDKTIGRKLAEEKEQEVLKDGKDLETANSRHIIYSRRSNRVIWQFVCVVQPSTKRFEASIIVMLTISAR